MTTGERAFGWLRNAVLGLFLSAIAAGLFVPIYTDEVGWHFQERAALDGVDKLFSDLCGPNTLAVPPAFMMPVRFYSAFFNTSFADPFYVRASGVLYALIWTALLMVLVGRLARDRASRAVLATLGVGFMTFGMMPMLLVWSRPEQPVVLAATAALLIAWIGSQDRTAETDPKIAWLRSVAIVALATVAYSYHLKAIFLTPVFLACLVLASHGRAALAPRLAMGLIFVGIAGWSAHYWVHRMECPDDAILRAAYAGNNMGVYLAGARSLPEVMAALGKIIGNVELNDYFGLPVPRPDPLSYWVEPDQIGQHHSSMWNRALIMTWWGAFLLALFCLGARAVTAWRERNLDPRLVFSGALLVTVLGWSATQAHRNVYEAIFVLPMMMLAIVFALSGNAPGSRKALWTKALALVVGVGGIASMLAVATIYAPSLARANRQVAYIAAQPFSQPAFGYASVKQDILGAAKLCGIADPAKAQGLMIDDVTYFAFMESRRPQHYLGVIGLWRGKIDDPMAYLRSRGSSGMIVGCHMLPEDLRRQAKSQGRFCCVAP